MLCTMQLSVHSTNRFFFVDGSRSAKGLKKTEILVFYKQNQFFYKQKKRKSTKHNFNLKLKHLLNTAKYLFFL